jgi:octaprenyl-diphosphate synthase
MTEPVRTKDLKELYAQIRDDMSLVEDALREFGRATNPLAGEIGGYLFAQGGKRIRPALLTLCAKLHGGAGSDHILWSALVEVIHTASLIHDDIIDNSDLRRGRDTVHTRWGPNITVLLGDHLYIRAIHAALKTRRLEIIDILAAASEAMIEGEILEYAASGDAGLSESSYLHILDKKTAALFAASCRIGAILGGADPVAAARLGEYGTNLGLAFQIVDDLLDFTGHSDEMGKPVLTDLREGRITLPLIYALRRTGIPARDELRRWIGDRRRDPAALTRVRSAVIDSGSVEEAAATAARFAGEARLIAAAYPRSTAAEALLRIPDFVLERRT